MAKLTGVSATLTIGTADDAGVTLPAVDTFTAIGAVRTISGPSGSKPEIDVTDLASAGKEYLGGIPDYGQVNFTGFHDEAEATQTTVWGDFNDASDTHIRNYQITFNDGTIYDFNGFVQELSHNVDSEAGIEWSGAIRVSGALTRTLA